MNQRIEDLQKITQVLDKSKISYALGGGGLLYALGLAELHKVGDWDITTEAPLSEIKEALGSFKSKDTPCGDYPFATKYKMLFCENGTEIEIVGTFAIYYDEHLCKIPTVVTRHWEEVKLGSPEAWFVAYTLMGRTKNARMLLTYLEYNGADPDILALLMKEPLPPVLVHTLRNLAPYKKKNRETEHHIEN
ncbi:hypothetical protein QWY14_03275 [Planococcus sp. N028]|uniref:Nucleotidyltransferase family protein n=1 Tax=Planococcus shixiaomingii TaxID=3058393 RepID=A0ABT8MYT0_9BACL|nr:hypothetical protein [Planococcus sp. N028]MDN7240792.1 hypothetical protein [Planococcus sp. N028]